MAFQKTTIVFVPEGAKKVKQFKVPRVVPRLLVILLAFLAASFFWLLQDYNRMKSKMPLLAQLERESLQQREQFLHLAGRIDSASREMRHLKEFDQKLKTMVNLQTSDEDDQFQGVGGSDPGLLDARRTLESSHRKLVGMMHRSLDNLENEIALSEQDKYELDEFLENQKMLLASTPSIWPSEGWLSSKFGYRISPFTGEREFHRGIDVATRMEAPVVAPADGIVSEISKDRGYGNMLLIKHGYGLMTKYAHLHKILVKKGQHVKRGETIALVGKTGRSTGPHLHYEVHLNRVAVNPLRYILD